MFDKLPTIELSPCLDSTSVLDRLSCLEQSGRLLVPVWMSELFKDAVVADYALATVP